MVELREIQSAVARNRTHLADQLLGRGRAEAAANEYKRALQVSPHSPVILNKLGRVMIGMNRSDEALPLFKKALEVDPDNANAYVQLGRAYHAAKNFQRNPDRSRRSHPDQPLQPAYLPFAGRRLRRARRARKSSTRQSHAWTGSAAFTDREKDTHGSNRDTATRDRRDRRFRGQTGQHARRDPQGHRRPGSSHRRSFDRAFRARPLLARRRARLGQNPADQHAGGNFGSRFQSDSVYART